MFFDQEGNIIGPHGGRNLPPGRGFDSSNPDTKFLKAFGKNNVVDKRKAMEVFLNINPAHSMESIKEARLSKKELEDFAISHQVFPNLNEVDARITADKIFKEIDNDGNGSLDFGEFYEYIKELAQEQKILKYVEKHYLTALPKSIQKSNTKKYTLPELEKELQARVMMTTTRDTDVFRSILTSFRKQVQNYTGSADKETISLNHKNFRMFLNFLGLFTTIEQSNALFAKYDADSNGKLTVHEFLTKAKAPDYPGMPVQQGMGKFRNQGKRIYKEGEVVRSTTPSGFTYDMGIESFKKRIRERLEQTARSGSAFPDWKARRKLMRAFESIDHNRNRMLPMKVFSRALELECGITMAGEHQRALANEFGDFDGLINYQSVVLAVYPEGGDSNAGYQASVIRSDKPTTEKVYKTQKWHAPRNKVFSTGSYWNNPPASASGITTTELPPLNVSQSSPSLASSRAGIRTPGSRAKPNAQPQQGYA